MTCFQFSLVKKVTVNYYAYLKSKAWKKKRISRLKKDGFKCQFIESGKYCHCKANLEVHHLTYERLGKERMSDLITLCHRHHSVIHNKII